MVRQYQSILKTILYHMLVVGLDFAVDARDPIQKVRVYLRPVFLAYRTPLCLDEISS